MIFKLFPYSEEPKIHNSIKENRHSIIVKTTIKNSKGSKGHSILLTGDAQEYTQSMKLNEGCWNNIITKDNGNKIKEALSSDILKVAHHGSINGSPTEIIKAIQPKYALITTKQTLSKTFEKGDSSHHPNIRYCKN